MWLVPGVWNWRWFRALGDLLCTAVLIFFAGFAGAEAGSGWCGGGWRLRRRGCRRVSRSFTIRSQFGFFLFVFSYLAVDFVPVGFFAVHDVVDLRAQVVEEFLFLLLRGGYDRRGFLGGFLGGFAFLLKLLHLVEGSVEDAGGVGSSPFDGADSFFECGVEEGVDYGVGGEFSVGEVAAAESPGGAGDLGGEVFFDDVDTVEGMMRLGDEELCSR